MDPDSRPSPAVAGFPDILVDDPGWRRAVPRAAEIARRAARVAGGADTVLLASDRAVRRLNWRYRGKNKPTNVLSFPSGTGAGGDLALGLGTVLREARAGGKRPGRHLAHLVVHGALHLRGHDHLRPGEAKSMEREEARLLHKLGVPNPWKGTPVTGGSGR